MKKRLLVTLVTIPSIVSISLALHLLPDDKELILEPDIDLYVPISDDCIENYNKLAAILESDFEIEWLPERPLQEVTDEEYAEFLLRNSDTIISNYRIASAYTSELIDIAADQCIGAPTTNFTDAPPNISEFRQLCIAHFDYWELSIHREDLSTDTSDLLIPYAVALFWGEKARTLIESLACTSILESAYDSIQRGYLLTSKEDLKAIESFAKVPANVAENLNNTLLAEYCLASTMFDLVEKEGQLLLPWLTYKRNRTLNTYAQNLQKQLELAKSHEWDALYSHAEKAKAEMNKLHTKNWAGWILLRSVSLSPNEFQKRAAETDQRREGLLTKIQEQISKR